MKPFVLPIFGAAEPGLYVGGDGWSSVAHTLRDCVEARGARLDPLLQAVVECAADAVPGLKAALVEMRSGDIEARLGGAEDGEDEGFHPLSLGPGCSRAG